MAQEINSPVIGEYQEIPGTKPIQKPKTTNDINSPVIGEEPEIAGGK
ncbi:MAG: hypothetical protein AB1567_01440 [bacterium]